MAAESANAASFNVRSHFESQEARLGCEGVKPLPRARFPSKNDIMEML